MKNLSLFSGFLSLFYVLFPFNIKAQSTIQVIYREKTMIDENKIRQNLKNKIENTARLQDLLFRLKEMDTVYHYYTLTISKGYSICKYDSTVGRGSKTTPIIYKDHVKKIIILDYPHIKGGQGVKPFPTLSSWEICYDKTLKIGGYRSFKATRLDKAGHRIEVWFTPDIPISDGPNSSAGLPGLVLRRITEGSINKYITNAIQINITKKDSIITLPNKKQLSVEEFTELARRSFGY